MVASMGRWTDVTDHTADRYNGRTST